MIGLGQLSRPSHATFATCCFSAPLDPTQGPPGPAEQRGVGRRAGGSTQGDWRRGWHWQEPPSGVLCCEWERDLCHNVLWDHLRCMSTSKGNWGTRHGRNKRCYFYRYERLIVKLFRSPNFESGWNELMLKPSTWRWSPIGLPSFLTRTMRLFCHTSIRILRLTCLPNP